MHPPCFAKKDDESFSFKKRVISVALQERAVSYIAPAYFVFPSMPSVPIDATMHRMFFRLQMQSNANTSS